MKLFVKIFADPVPVPEADERRYDAEDELDYEPLVVEIYVHPDCENVSDNPYPPLLDIRLGQPPCPYNAERRGNGIQEGIGVVKCLQQEIEGRDARCHHREAYQEGLAGKPVQDNALMLLFSCICTVFLPVVYAYESHYDIVDVEGGESPGCAIEKIERGTDATGNVKIPHPLAVHYLENEVCHEGDSGNYFENVRNLLRQECKNHICVLNRLQI